MRCLAHFCRASSCASLQKASFQSFQYLVSGSLALSTSHGFQCLSPLLPSPLAVDFSLPTAIAQYLNISPQYLPHFMHRAMPGRLLKTSDISASSHSFTISQYLIISLYFILQMLIKDTCLLHWRTHNFPMTFISKISTGCRSDEILNWWSLVPVSMLGK